MHAGNKNVNVNLLHGEVDESGDGYETMVSVKPAQDHAMQQTARPTDVRPQTTRRTERQAGGPAGGLATVSICTQHFLRTSND